MVVRVDCICVVTLLRGVDWVYLLSSENKWLIWSKIFLMMRLSVLSVVGGTDVSAEVDGFEFGLDAMTACWSVLGGLDNFIGGSAFSLVVGLGSRGVMGSILSKFWSVLVMKLRTAGELGLFLTCVDFCVLGSGTCFFLCGLSFDPKAAVHICFLSMALVGCAVAIFASGMKWSEWV